MGKLWIQLKGDHFEPVVLCSVSVPVSEQIHIKVLLDLMFFFVFLSDILLRIDEDSLIFSDFFPPFAACFIWHSPCWHGVCFLRFLDILSGSKTDVPLLLGTSEDVSVAHTDSKQSFVQVCFWVFTGMQQVWGMCFNQIDIWFCFLIRYCDFFSPFIKNTCMPCVSGPFEG